MDGDTAIAFKDFKAELGQLGDWFILIHLVLLWGGLLVGLVVLALLAVRCPQRLLRRARVRKPRKYQSSMVFIYHHLSIFIFIVEFCFLNLAPSHWVFVCGSVTPTLQVSYIEPSKNADQATQALPSGTKFKNQFDTPERQHVLNHIEPERLATSNDSRTFPFVDICGLVSNATQANHKLIQCKLLTKR